MKLIVGLGNPGVPYKNTRHNVGFFMVDALQQAWNASDWQDSKFSGLLSEVTRQGEKIILFKPTTFMNLSGNAVARLVQFYKIDIQQDMIVIADDLDQDFGNVRYRQHGSHGGHNGFRDIIAKIGNSNFPRIKVGIGRNELYQVSDWVLSQFTKKELEALHGTITEEVQKKIFYHWKI